MPASTCSRAWAATTSSRAWPATTRSPAAPANDKFLFNTALNAATNVDTITDMTAGVDIIRLDDAFFAGIGAVGVLNADAFHIGAAAADAEDRIVYNSATGQLFFDSNGNAAGGSTLFANLATGLALSNTDFRDGVTQVADSIHQSRHGRACPGHDDSWRSAMRDQGRARQHKVPVRRGITVPGRPLRDRIDSR